MNEKIERLQLKAAELTRKTHALGIPVMIVFEGVPASGKTRLANELLLTLDAKYTHFIATKTPSDEDLRYQFLQKFWETLPSKGDINIYFRSWYAQYIDYKVHGIKQSVLKNYDHLYHDIESFEKMLIEDHHELIKFYINIDEEKRQEHITQMKENPLTNWKAQEFERVIPSNVYRDTFKPLLNDDWKMIDYTERESAIEQMYNHLIKRLERAIKAYEKRERVVEADFTEGFQTDMFNPATTKVKKRTYESVIEALQKRLRELQFALYERKIPLVLVYEGMDAAGKGGNIKRVRQLLDPTGYEVNTTSAPTDVELNHHYLWRFAKAMPKSGHISIFDRSWYGRVLVERVEGFATQNEWSRAYDEINEFEKMWTHDGAIILKFFLSLDKDEQLKRFEDRQKNPDKQWKITDEDWRNREKWDMYLEASHDMIVKTNTAHAPWLVVPADHKKTARIQVLKYIIQKCEEKLWGVKQY
ncbi:MULTISPECIES: phosphate--AMP phosphotransferase [unclassified Staphylococcus]|uniref:phosphate--AMP phosphotransferase n=1 Tax=unclassified Staphylococcus TaxID=91994 RepID=UPI0021D109DF|nr:MULTISPECIES: phosphate--AMP phosphotransferase [unclassified Staphylococcus]UXR71497.1 phosphate--AMP phosphotransferase [Staphylococcus sp. IVB6240]UXR73775.1 phosphate--AMP phosphotransferase [Staphylococcus sp. IVB6238]UXR76094.1 phosphate--AMP phosphotransferase [Staphylococcus sp. IVB6233]UXR80292.1 phosphate--AMP phosphotransferase [Staphylococcus sp. IVB6218]